jgi:alpha-glucosidase
MNLNNETYKDVLFSSVFSDGTELFRQPSEPKPGDSVTIRLRIMKGADVKVSLLHDFPAVHMSMTKCRTDEMFDWYEAVLKCGDKPVLYSFLIEWQGKYIHFDRLCAEWMDCVPAPDPDGSFLIIPGFHVPEWSRGALQYQIFPDRFRKGNPDNDIKDREYWYANDYIRHAESWESMPETDDYHCFYGGDLQGVMEKLDYIQSLGVEAIYFNPIFISPSPHGYDTQDYFHVDPHLTVIPVDTGDVLEPGDMDNSHATLYRTRTTDPRNLKASNEWFAGLCKEIHRRGMKIILDGVFNHCGSFGQWMNSEGIYEGDKGAYGNPDSHYRSFFSFSDDHDYHCWWDIETLPKLYYERFLYP